MTADDISIAVIIAAFNPEATIGRAVASALAQKHVAEVSCPMASGDEGGTFLPMTASRRGAA